MIEQRLSGTLRTRLRKLLRYDEVFSKMCSYTWLFACLALARVWEQKFIGFRLFRLLDGHDMPGLRYPENHPYPRRWGLTNEVDASAHAQVVSEDASFQPESASMCFHDDSNAQSRTPNSLFLTILLRTQHPHLFTHDANIMASKLWNIGFPSESWFRHPDGQVMVVLRKGISDCVFLIPSAPFEE